MELRGTSAVVTGAASGLGAATAAALAGSGVSVVGLDLARSWERVPAPPPG
jgi:NAD(P)-dependent dehydrogenase (short-subunit alcohol dehydrogenase family)